MLRPIISAFLFLTIAATTHGQSIHAITVSGPITPATAAYVDRAALQAHNESSSALLIRLNTPGGLLQSTRQIVHALLESGVPVIVYVSPSGSQAGSAGVFITLAAHVAAMANGTNIGAAHPVGFQGPVDSVMNDKATNDAAAFIRSIAQHRNRNFSWAEDAVRRSVALSEQEALKEGVIDLLAEDDRSLLSSLNGRMVLVRGDSVRLQTVGASIIEVEPSFSESFLGVLSDPNIAYILFLLGLYGLLFELYNPGSILPGVVGGISIILAFYALQTLPINYAGIALILFAVVLFLLEVKITSHGLLGLGGGIALLLGSIMLIRPTSQLELVEISWSVIILGVGLTTFFFLVVVSIGLRAQRLKPSTGVDGMIGQIGRASSDIGLSGTASVRGEIWNCRSMGSPIRAGTEIRVAGVERLTLVVEPVQTQRSAT